MCCVVQRNKSQCVQAVRGQGRSRVADRGHAQERGHGPRGQDVEGTNTMVSHETCRAVSSHIAGSACVICTCVMRPWQAHHAITSKNSILTLHRGAS
ncbi:hypothetical protein J6590_103529 [Homalodisca vitripennis]|nr:hypothetical protein J6590_103529 [Homalodisca vitripennis]